MSDKYPNREQAERMKAEECADRMCNECYFERWCGPYPASIAMLAMHDALDEKQAEIDRLREYLRDVQGELLIRFDNHEMPDLNMIEIAQRIDAFLSPSPLCDGDD